MSEDRKPAPGNEDAPPDSSIVGEDDSERPREHGGPKGLEPTRYGDWEKNGRCYDF